MSRFAGLTSWRVLITGGLLLAGGWWLLYAIDQSAGLIVAGTICGLGLLATVLIATRSRLRATTFIDYAAPAAVQAERAARQPAPGPTYVTVNNT
ncbi:MAG: hypothetical protein ACLQFR_29915, partial [Streptosporangiaceae bacterium]